VSVAAAAAEPAGEREGSSVLVVFVGLMLVLLMAALGSDDRLDRAAHNRR